jgi:hypothetical protein
LTISIADLATVRARHPEAVAEAAVTDDPDDMAEVLETSTLPAVLLGGEVGGSPEEEDGAYERWHKALRLPTVQGLVVGRSLLYPSSGNVEAAVDTAVGLL